MFSSGSEYGQTFFKYSNNNFNIGVNLPTKFISVIFIRKQTNDVKNYSEIRHRH